MTLRLKSHDAALLRQCSRKTTKLEQPAFDTALATPQAKALDCGRVLVRITSVRKRLLDEDNLCGKYHCDLLRYAGIISADTPERCQIETRQRKAGKGEAETVMIEVFEIEPVASRPLLGPVDVAPSAHRTKLWQHMGWVWTNRSSGGYSRIRKVGPADTHLPQLFGR